MELQETQNSQNNLEKRGTTGFKLATQLKQLKQRNNGIKRDEQLEQN
jgi:hypothetical protein